MSMMIGMVMMVAVRVKVAIIYGVMAGMEALMGKIVQTVVTR